MINIKTNALNLDVLNNISKRITFNNLFNKYKQDDSNNQYDNFNIDYLKKNKKNIIVYKYNDNITFYKFCFYNNKNKNIQFNNDKIFIKSNKLFDINKFDLIQLNNKFHDFVTYVNNKYLDKDLNDSIIFHNYLSFLLNKLKNNNNELNIKYIEFFNIFSDDDCVDDKNQLSCDIFIYFKNYQYQFVLKMINNKMYLFNKNVCGRINNLSKVVSNYNKLIQLFNNICDKKVIIKL